MIRLFVKTGDTILATEVASVHHGKRRWEDIFYSTEVVNDDTETNMVWVQDFDEEVVYEWDFSRNQWMDWRMDENYETLVEQVEETIDLLGPRV